MSGEFNELDDLLKNYPEKPSDQSIDFPSPQNISDDKLRSLLLERGSEPNYINVFDKANDNLLKQRLDEAKTLGVKKHSEMPSRALMLITLISLLACSGLCFLTYVANFDPELLKRLGLNKTQLKTDQMLALNQTVPFSQVGIDQFTLTALQDADYHILSLLYNPIDRNFIPIIGLKNPNEAEEITIAIPPFSSLLNRPPMGRLPA